MVRLIDIPEPRRSYLASLECPEFPATPWVTGPDPEKVRISIVSTAGLHLEDDDPFGMGSDDFRVIPGGPGGSEIVMSHVSPNFDRTGFNEDVNVIFPVDRLNDMVKSGAIGSVGKYHYSFMGATDPRSMEPNARKVASLLKEDAVNAVLLVPV